MQTNTVLRQNPQGMAKTRFAHRSDQAEQLTSHLRSCCCQWTVICGAATLPGEPVCPITWPGIPFPFGGEGKCVCDREF